ncbi:hypothetical protein D3C75_986980 [compost metagenome]
MEAKSTMTKARPTRYRLMSARYGEITEPLIIITAAMKSLENGFSLGLQTGATAPLVHSLSTMPSREGTTIIQNRLLIMAPVSSSTLVPISSDNTPGTTKGASSVSIRMMDKVRAVLPL